jgi:hypothetical protein
MKGERENVDERGKRGEVERTWIKVEREGRKREHGWKKGIQRHMDGKGR